MQFWCQATEPALREGHAGRHRDVLLAINGIGDRITRDWRAEVDLPEHLARALIECAEAAIHVAPEQQSTTRRHDGHRAGPLLELPRRDAGLGGDGVNGADVAAAVRRYAGLLVGDAIERGVLAGL